MGHPAAPGHSKARRHPDRLTRRLFTAAATAFALMSGACSPQMDSVAATPAHAAGALAQAQPITGFD